jgi:Arc/MetJ-type ribon-helix-helix transcriptional regulator
MKITIDLPQDDLSFLDAYAKRQGYQTRSDVLHRAVALLATTELSPDYESAWNDWNRSGEADVWSSTNDDTEGPA